MGNIWGTRAAEGECYIFLLIPDNRQFSSRLVRAYLNLVDCLSDDLHLDQDLVFAEPNGDYLQPDLVSQTVIRRIRKAGIKRGSFHSPRHTLASILLSKGVPHPRAGFGTFACYSFAV